MKSRRPRRPALRRRPKAEIGAKPSQSQPALARKIPPLEPLERKLRQKLARGRIGPDAVIDLRPHPPRGLHVSLRAVSRAGPAGRREARAVVTGKGRGAGVGCLSEEETAGVLRRSVPQWLRAADYHSIVVGFEEASRPHGGAGALYVRLRRRRPLPDEKAPHALHAARLEPDRPPSIDDFDLLARDAYAELPAEFRRLCEGLIIRVEDFPTTKPCRRWTARPNSICSACSAAGPRAGRRDAAVRAVSQYGLALPPPDPRFLGRPGRYAGRHRRRCSGA